MVNMLLQNMLVSQVIVEENTESDLSSTSSSVHYSENFSLQSVPLGAVQVLRKQIFDNY